MRQYLAPLVLHLPALHELDYLAIRAGDERYPHFNHRILAQSNRSRFNTGFRSGGDSSSVRRVGIRDLQAEMQQRALGPFLVRLAPPPLCLNG